MSEPLVRFSRFPVTGPMTGGFGDWYKRLPSGVVVGTTADDPARGWQHRGIDIAVRQQAVVSPLTHSCRAVAPYNDGTFGIAVCLHHGDGWLSLYAHLESQAVFPGDVVEPGQVIGVSGNTGGVPYHLHWQLSDSPTFPTDISHSRNPLDYLISEDAMKAIEDLQLALASGSEEAHLSREERLANARYRIALAAEGQMQSAADLAMSAMVVAKGGKA